MTKMSIYDKYYGEKDRRVSEYFRHDYIFRQNMWTRLFVIIGAVIVLLFYWTHKIVIDGMDIFNMDYKQAITDSGFFILAVAVFYTFIGTIKAAMDFSVSQKRLRKYENLITRLERTRKDAEELAEEASDLYYGTDLNYERNDS